MNSKPKHSVAEVLTKHIDNYADHYGKLTSKQNKVVNLITQCKTALQGGHAYSCTTCGKLKEKLHIFLVELFLFYAINSLNNTD